jgi:hypothetical protein
MAVIAIAKPSEVAVTSGMPFVANVADDAEVREIVVRVGRYGSLRLSFNEAQNMQSDLLLAVSREGLLSMVREQAEGEESTDATLPG